jgi:hypothetical protein
MLGLRQTHYRGRERLQMHAYLVATAYNLLKIARLARPPNETAALGAVLLDAAGHNSGLNPVNLAVHLRSHNEN